MKWIDKKIQSAPTDRQIANSMGILITDGYQVCIAYHVDRQYGDGPDKMACSECGFLKDCDLKWSRKVTHWMLIKKPKGIK